MTAAGETPSEQGKERREEIQTKRSEGGQQYRRMMVIEPCYVIVGRKNCLHEALMTDSVTY